ncbi:uncharacterized protein LOC117174327 isoform X1 [Belonocnema kinseyi]|uniref:uncharacterized protein LOC117174327 isoform X1 n=1 Tax=Belonocnema kinseyi TaxID=2817044 RepID=UPI00143D00AE|nr:uncharacterized protein LOC117174327 isoform X1 [Belonocnema kinseyi]
MDSEMPYLEAIQKIPGNSAKEKHESLNKIIKEIIESKQMPGDFALQTSYGSPIPKSLQPLIQIETAKILKNTDDVIAALKSEDLSIVSRGLQVDWIFDGSNNITNLNYFSVHIFPEVSLNTRSSIIKRLSQCLGQKKEYSRAQEFFEGLSKTYDLKQAMPLLTACSENYISEFIKNGNVALPKKVVTRLFRKYPELIINYLKFCKPKSDEERVVDSLSINDYLELLPRLIKNHLNDFIDIVNSFNYTLEMKIGNKCAEFFLKGKGLDALIEFPKKYLPLLSLKLVTTKLNKEQFELMFRNLFPKNKNDFSLSKMFSYLEFQPQELKLSLVRNNFRDLYGVDLLTLLDKVTPELMLILSEKDRIDVARKKLAENPCSKNCEESWVCYLSTKDSIPEIKDQILNTKEMDDRAELVGQLIYTCKVNNSKEDLLLVLEYISSRHRNEISIFWSRVYESLLRHFDLEILSANHWNILNEMIKRSHVKDDLNERPTVSEKLIEKGIYFNLLNDKPIEDLMTLLAEVKIKGWNSNFNIIRDNPEFEKICLETFIEIIPRKFPDDDEIWEDNRVDTIQKLTEGIYDYNERVAKKKILKELLYLGNYPWLFEEVKKIIVLENQRMQYKIEKLKSLVRIHESKLYDSLFLQKNVIASVSSQEGLNFLKKEPGKILENWKLYLDSCVTNIYCTHTKRFIKKCTWYREIPLKFVEEALKKLDDPRTLMILALLLQGPEFVRIIEPMMPDSDKMDIDGDAKKSFRMISSIPTAINLANPPPSLELVGKFCKGDYLSLGLASLMNVARRVSVKKVITFAKALVDNPVSVRKHGIRLMATIAPTEDLCEFFKHLWKNEKHKSIREVVFQKTHVLFINRPCKETWQLMRFCIEGLTKEDIECFNVLKEISNVPNDYIKDYFETGLYKIEKLDLTPDISNQLISSFLRNATSKVCAFFPEDYSRLLVEKFAFDGRDEVSVAGRLYAINFLIDAKEKLESRLRYFCNLLSTAISKHWDKPHPKNLRFYPMKQCFSEIIGDIVNTEIIIRIDPAIPKAILNLFDSSLKPVQDSNSYLSLFFVIQLRKVEFDGRLFGLTIGKEMSNLLMFFTGEMIVDIAEVLSNVVLPLRNLESKEGSFIGSLTEALAELNLIHASIVAAIMLFKNHTLIPDEQYENIVEKLRKVSHPAVVAFLSKHFVSTDVNEVYEL